MNDPTALAPLTPKGEPIFEFKYRILNSEGDDADLNPDEGKVEAEIEFGRSLRVQLLVRDLRAQPTGIFSTYSDLVYTNVDGSVAAIIEPISIREDGSIVDSMISDRWGLKQGQFFDNQTQVAGQRILKGIGEYGLGFKDYITDNEFHVVMDVMFNAKEQGTVELKHQLREHALGIAGIVPFDGTGDYLGPAEVILPTATIRVTGGVPIFSANDDFSVRSEDELHVIDILSNDSDLTGTAQVVLPIAPPPIGGDLFWVNGRVLYVPPPNFFGTTSFTYSLRIADGREDSATVNLVIAEVNDPPIISRVAPVIARENTLYYTDPFFVSPGDAENQLLRVIATSNSPSILPNPVVESLGGGYYRIIGQTALGYLGTGGIVIDAEDAGNDGLFETIEDNSISTMFVPVLSYPNIGDFGDAPTSDQSGMVSSYPTRFDQNGAFHVGTALRLGSLIDKESDGEPEPQAKGDDTLSTPDEDGILFPFTHPINDQESTLSSYVANVSEDGFLDSWIDFNRDGDWSDLGETISWSVPVFAGRNIIPFEIPKLSLTGTVDTTFARFRLSRNGMLSYTGYGGEGEVEDYAILMNRNLTQELEAYDHILGPHEVNVVDGRLIITVGEKVVYRAPVDGISVFRRENWSGETTFEMKAPGQNMPGQLSYSDHTGRLELELHRSQLDLEAHTEFLIGINAIRLGQYQAKNIIDFEHEHIQRLNAGKTLRIEMTKDDALRTQSQWKASNGRFENGVWVQVYIVTSAFASNGTLATLEVVSEAAWRNETRTTDADGDATTSPLDVLALVNLINDGLIAVGERLPPRTESSITKFPDVDGDQYFSALDVLQIINYINSRGNDNGSGGEGEGAPAMASLRSHSLVSPHDIDHYMYSYADDFDQDNRTTRRRRSL
ncbi:MAG: Ig-like domain-containing protein [Pirellula sp.]|nr:Ig-like domain-containing protein [Pirellula sp.]